MVFLRAHGERVVYLKSGCYGRIKTVVLSVCLNQSVSLLSEKQFRQGDGVQFLNGSERGGFKRLTFVYHLYR